MRRSQLATTTSMQKISEKEAQKEKEVRDRFGKLILLRGPLFIFVDLQLPPCRTLFVNSLLIV